MHPRLRHRHVAGLLCNGNIRIPLLSDGWEPSLRRRPCMARFAVRMDTVDYREYPVVLAPEDVPLRQESAFGLTSLRCGRPDVLSLRNRAEGEEEMRAVCARPLPQVGSVFQSSRPLRFDRTHLSMVYYAPSNQEKGKHDADRTRTSRWAFHLLYRP